MRITTQAWETYIRRLAQLNEKAAQLMAEYLAAHGTADTEALTDYAAALVQKYGEGSADLSCCITISRHHYRSHRKILCIIQDIFFETLH